MKNKVFLDSNILIYLYSVDEKLKQEKVKTLLNDCSNIVISTQVLFEFTHIAYKKFKLDYSQINIAWLEFNRFFSIETLSYNTFQLALKIATKYKYSFVDSLTIASALENNCEVLYSEDMHSGAIIEKTLVITNPL